MKKIIITGTGSLSSALAEWIRKRNHAEVATISLRDGKWEMMDFSDIETIVHVVGVTPDKAKSENDYYTINRDLTRNLAKKAKNEGVHHFVFFSSMAVYGIEPQLSENEGTVDKATIPNPSSAYGKSKFQAEEALEQLQDSRFLVSLIRIPSIYGKGRREYLEQYRYLADKFPLLPAAYPSFYKSAICVENLCELVSLLIDNPINGSVCPDDGQYSTVDFCKAIYPSKKLSFLAGKMVELLLGRNDRIRDYFGCVCYSKELSNAFDGQYRIVPFKEAVRKAYE